MTVKCSCCNSITQIKTTGVMTDTFVCPICLDGEIDYRVEQPRIYRGESEFPIEERTLITTKTR